MPRGRPRGNGATGAKPQQDSAARLGFEAKLWQAADALRNNMDAAEYKHVVLGLIFLKYISDAFEAKHAELDAERALGADPEDPDEYRAENIFWVPPEARWSLLKGAAPQPTIGQTVDAAMDAIERDNPSLKGVLPKEYARPGLDKQRLGQLINLVSDIGLGSAADRARDILGRVYEYFLSQFASAEGKKGGQFYTPTHVVRVLVEMLAPYKGRVFDPCCGSGGMFVQSAKFIAAHANGNGNGGKAKGDISIYGQESNYTTWRLARMNLAIRGIDAQIAHGDSFHNDRHPDLKADYVLANPPFNDSDWRGELLRKDKRWVYGTPPVGNANFAWVQHFIHHLAPHGRAGFVLANGSMSSNQSGEGEIRRAIVEADLVDCMVALPGQLFYATQIPVCLWFLARDKRNGRFRDRRGESLFIDARKLGTMIDRVHRELTEADIAKIAGTYHAWRGDKSAGDYADVPGFCKSATLDDIRRHGHALTPAAMSAPAPPRRTRSRSTTRCAGLSRYCASNRRKRHGSTPPLPPICGSWAMAGEWRELSLRKAGVQLLDCEHRTPPAALTGFPYIAIPQVKDGRLDLGDVRLISSQHFADWTRKARPQQWDVILSRRCNPGETAVVPAGLDCALGQNLVLLRADGKHVMPEFLRWLVRSPVWWQQINAFINVGAVFDSLKCADIPHFRLPIPPLHEQRAIARILGALDDKINMNWRMNETLEAMARALFKSWFVDFDPVRARAEGHETGLPDPIANLFPDCLVDSELGEIPEGWIVKGLDEIAQFLNGLALQKYPAVDGHFLPVIKIAQLRASNTEGADRASADLDHDYIVQDGDILFSWSGSLECILWAGGPGALNQHLFKVTSSKYPKWLCYLGVHHHLDDFRQIAAGKATTMGHIQRHHLSAAKLAIPPPSRLSAMGAAMGSIIESIWRRNVQSRTLAALRDALLPKLISGEIRVRDAGAASERALVAAG